MYPDNNNNNNNNNIIIIIIKGKKNQKGREGVEREREVREKIILIFFSLRFFLRSMKIGSQVFVGAEGKVDLRNESYA